MILVSVGTQLPFDRMVRAIDDWAVRSGKVEVVAQVGRSTYEPKAIRAFPFLSPAEFRTLQEEADFHVAHAGMGSILTALEFRKPIVIMPRDHERGEHRNGHQLATAKRFMDTPGVHVAMDVDELVPMLDKLHTMTAAAAPLSLESPRELTQRLRSFIADDSKGRIGWRLRLPGGARH